MKSSGERHSSWPLIAGIVVGVLVLTAGPAFAALTFSGTAISGDSGGIVIDTPSTISIGTSTAVGITIGNTNATTTFPGNDILNGQVTMGGFPALYATDTEDFFGFGATPTTTSPMTASYDIVMGPGAGANITGGGSNVVMGYQAGQSLTTGNLNVFIGQYNGQHDTTGFNNTFIGPWNDGDANTTGNNNLFMGAYSGHNNTIGTNNVFLGNAAGQDNTSGTGNIFIGAQAGEVSTSTGGLVALGYETLANNTGASSTAIGYLAGNTNTSGGGNTFLGYGADVGTGGLTNSTAIGIGAIVAASNSMVLGGTGAHAVSVGIGTSTPSALLQVIDSNNNSSTIRIGAPSKNACLEMGAASGTIGATVYVYFDSNAAIYATTTKPSFCQ